MFNNVLNYIPLVSFGVSQIEVSREKMLLTFLAEAIEQDALLVPMLISFSEDHQGEWNEKILELAYLLKNNYSLPDALEKAGGLVPVGAIPLIRIGMETDQPSQALRMIADNIQLDTESDQITRTNSFAGYILSLIFILVFITGFIMVYLIPKFKAIFNDFHSELPPLTRWLIEASDFIANYFSLFLLVAVILYIFLQPIFQYGMIHVTFLRKFRLFQFFTRKLWVPDILRGLSITADSQKPLLEPIKILARHVNNKEMSQKLTNAEIRIQGGQPVWQSLSDENIIKPEEMNIFEAAERTGNLPWALKSIATRRDDRSNMRFMNFIMIAEPLVIIIIGLCVGIVVTGIFVQLVKLINNMA